MVLDVQSLKETRMGVDVGMNMGAGMGTCVSERLCEGLGVNVDASANAAPARPATMMQKKKVSISTAAQRQLTPGS